MTISVLGIDLAKQVFQLHGVDEQGQVVLRRKLIPFSIHQMSISTEKRLWNGRFPDDRRSGSWRCRVGL